MAAFAGVGIAAPAASSAPDAWADRVTFYDAGTGPVGSFTDPTTGLGSPERFTGEGVFPQVVSMFNPPWRPDEVVGITGTGSLVVEFDEPITNDPGHEYGIDLVVFGNGGFNDDDWPNGLMDSNGGLLGLDQMRVSVSADGLTFFSLGNFWEGLFPTQGYRDVGQYSTSPGMVATDFTRPMNPALTPADFAALNFNSALALYGESGGGTPIDIGPSGLASVRFVKVELAPGGINDLRLEIDAMAAVPEPVTAFGFLSVTALALVAERRARRRRT